jgi:hypothetical protein
MVSTTGCAIDNTTALFPPSRLTLSRTVFPNPSLQGCQWTGEMSQKELIRQAESLRVWMAEHTFTLAFSRILSLRFYRKREKIRSWLSPTSIVVCTRRRWMSWKQCTAELSPELSSFLMNIWPIHPVSSLQLHSVDDRMNMLEMLLCTLHTMYCNFTHGWDPLLTLSAGRQDEFRAWREVCKRCNWNYEYLAFSLATKQAIVRVKNA